MWWAAPSLGCFNNTHLGTSDAVSERRPPHHRNSSSLREQHLSSDCNSSIFTEKVLQHARNTRLSPNLLRNCLAVLDELK
jgi:hypothetical protein